MRLSIYQLIFNGKYKRKMEFNFNIESKNEKEYKIRIREGMTWHHVSFT